MEQEKIELAIIEQKLIKKQLEAQMMDTENLTQGEEAAIRQEQYAVEYSINVLKAMKK